MLRRIETAFAERTASEERLRRFVADAVADALVLGPTRPVTLDAVGPVLIRGDAARLRQVLANLFANVRHHTPPGTPANIRVRATDTLATLQVTDHGPGFPPHFLDR